MIKEKKHNKILIGIVAVVLSIVCVLLPFIGSSKSKVFADTVSTGRYNGDTHFFSTIPTRLISNNLPTSFYYNNNIWDLSFNLNFVNTRTTENVPVFDCAFSNAYYLYMVSSNYYTGSLKHYALTSTTDNGSDYFIRYDSFAPVTSTLDRTSVYFGRLSTNSSVSTYYGFSFYSYLERYNTVVDGVSSTYLDTFNFDYLYSLTYSYESFSSSLYGVGTYSIRYTCRIPYVYTNSDGVSVDYYKYMDYVISFMLPDVANNNSFFSHFNTGTKYFDFGLVTDTDIYDSAFTNGYSSGQVDGYANGYSQGTADGYRNGYNVGYEDGLEEETYTFVNVIGAVIDAPIQGITGLLNFELFGVNLSGFFYGLITVALVLVIIRFIKGGR